MGQERERAVTLLEGRSSQASSNSVKVNAERFVWHYVYIFVKLKTIQIEFAIIHNSSR